jgi:glycosyltransferase involved in cell wall biosynthesis
VRQNVRVRVVHLITDLNVGGAEVMLVRLIERLDRNRIENVVIALDATGPLATRIRQTGVAVFGLDMTPNWISPFALWRLATLLRRLRPDILQTWLYHADFAGLIGGALARVPRIVWNIRCAELDPRDHPRSLRPLLRLLAFASARPRAIVSNSIVARRAHEQLGYSPQRWSIIPNGFDTTAFHPGSRDGRDLRAELGLGRSTTMVGLMARFHPMKDHATFLRAAARVARLLPDVHFVAAGRGVDNLTLNALAAELKLEAAVHLIGAQVNAAAFLASLDLVVSSSYSEAFPNVIGEAMACGVPCVVTDVGDSAEIVGKCGIVVPPRDPEALADGILRALALDETSRRALGAAARERIATVYSIERAARRYEALYEELLNGPAGVTQSICAE